jgi:hypothetical protein
MMIVGTRTDGRCLELMTATTGSKSFCDWADGMSHSEIDEQKQLSPTGS